MRGRDLATAIGGLAAIGAAIFAVGGAVRGAQALVAVLVAAALATQLTSRRVLERRSPLIVVLGVAAALTALQLVPLPGGLAAALAPAGSALRADGAALIGLDAAPVISLDPAGTWRGLAFFVTLLGVAVVALRVAASERGRYQLAAGVALLCGAAAVSVGVHELVGARRLYGAYDADHAAPALLGPLLNLNHLGCLMAVGATAAIGLAAYRRQPAWARAGWLAIASGCGVVAVATASRGATIALAAGAAVTAGVLAGQWLRGGETPRRRARFLTSSLPIAVVVACAVVVVVYAGASNVERQLARTSFDELAHPRSKYMAWRSSLELIAEAPWLGVGRGAFEASFTRVHPTSGLATYSHVENGYLQAVVDWGVIGALALGAAAVWLAVVAVRRWRDGPLAAGALGALAVVAMQSNVDFGIELLGVAAPAVALAAIVTHVPVREATGRALAAARGVRALQVAALVAAAALLRSLLTTTIDEDHAALARPDVTRAEVRGAIARHPLDYFGYAAAAQLAGRAGERDAIKLLNHALRLHPSHAGLHRTAARLLYREGHLAQAAVEYAAAVRGTPAPRALLEEIAGRLPRELAAEAIPADTPALADTARLLEELGRGDVAVAWLARVLALRGPSMRACDLLYDLALRRRDVHAVARAAAPCAAYEPGPPRRLALARVTAEQGGHAAALDLLDDVERWPGRVEDKVAGWLLRCDALVALARWDDARRCLRRLEVTGYAGPARAELTHRLDQLELARRAAAEAAPPP